MPESNDKKRTFLFSTAGVSSEKKTIKDHGALREILVAKGYDIVGDFACKGFNTNSVLKHLAHTDGVLSLMKIEFDQYSQASEANGGECLKRAAAALKRCILREGDFVARYGGGTFIAVLQNVDKYGARLVARRMLHAIRDLGIPNENSAMAKCVTVSIGVAAGGVRHTHSLGDYLSLADEMLLLSKKDGGNRYSLSLLP